MPGETPVPADVKAWEITFDAWLQIHRRGDEPPDTLTDLKNALLDDVLEQRGITPTRRAYPSAPTGPGSARADPMQGEPSRSDPER
jgi:hypothetical protein